MAADLGIVCATSGLPARGLQLLDLADALHAYPPETPEWGYRLTDRSYMLNLADRHEDTFEAAQRAHRRLRLPPDDRVSSRPTTRPAR